MLKSIIQKQIAPISLLTILGTAGVAWLVENAIAPQVAQAYTARIKAKKVMRLLSVVVN
jgi:hypothetical protein